MRRLGYLKASKVYRRHSLFMPYHSDHIEGENVLLNGYGIAQKVPEHGGRNDDAYPATYTN